jgi:hAT family C-terminal dimerisation region
MKWFKKQDWKDDLIEKHKQRSHKRFETEYNSLAASIIPFKRQFIDSSDEDEDFNEFDQFVRSKRHTDIKYPLLWWANSRSTFPRLANMARDVYAVPATGCGVEREFSMSGNVVNKPRNRLHGKTIAKIMQYKRWVTNTHQSFVIEENAEMYETMEGWSDSEDDLEYNQGLVDWLEKWEREKRIDERAEEVLQAYH